MRILIYYIILDGNREYGMFVHLDCSEKSPNEAIVDYFEKYCPQDSYSWIFDSDGKLLSIEELFLKTECMNIFETDEDLKDFLFDHLRGD